MKRIVNLFPVTVLEVDIDQSLLLNNQLLSMIKNLFENSTSNRVLSHHWKHNIQESTHSKLGYSSFNESDISKDPNFKFFFDAITPTINEFFQQLDYTSKWKFENSWSNIYPKGAYVPTHDHRGVHWSAVYYVQADNNCGELLVIDPKEYALSYEPENTKYRGNHLSSFVPVPGKLIMFPGYLKHESDPNQSDSDRIIISFNVNCYDS